MQGGESEVGSGAWSEELCEAQSEWSVAQLRSDDCGAYKATSTVWGRAWAGAKAPADPKTDKTNELPRRECVFECVCVCPLSPMLLVTNAVVVLLYSQAPSYS